MKDAPRASEKNRADGWTIDYEYLQRIHEKMDSDYRVGLEEIEAVLLAVEHDERGEMESDERVESEQEEWRRHDRPNDYLSHDERFPRRC